MWREKVWVKLPHITGVKENDATLWSWGFASSAIYISPCEWWKLPSPSSNLDDVSVNLAMFWIRLVLRFAKKQNQQEASRVVLEKHKEASHFENEMCKKKPEC